MMRQISQFDIGGARLQGTFHPAANAHPGESVGLLFTNAGLLPRSARGDLAAKFADTFSGWGYPCFRFDLPGLGDSSGEVPEDVLGYYEWVQEGKFADVTLKLAAELCKRHQLSGMVLVGHCGSATTAAFTKLRDQGGVVKGLILLDPSFILYQAVTPGPKAPAKPQPQPKPAGAKSLKARVQDFRQEFVKTKFGFALKTIWRRTRKLCLSLRGSVLPKNTNLPVIKAWLEFGRSGLPMLVFHADRGDRDIAFDYLHYLHKATRGAIKYTSVKNTNHSFVEGPGPEAVRSGVRAWLSTHFPIREQNQKQSAPVPQPAMAR